MSLLSKTFIFVLAGGSGERFWPLSRKNKPKQLLKLFSDKTLLEETLIRVDGLAPTTQTFILTNVAQKKVTHDLLSNFPEERILTEPTKRDTGPAAALATAIAYSLNPDAIVVLLPSDQLVKATAKFQQVILDAVLVASLSESIVTVALQPSYPATGFGYMELGQSLAQGCSTSFQQVERFVEKPNLTQAEEYLVAKKYFWNAGIFIWKASTFLKETQNQCPELAKFVENYPQTDSFDYVEKHFPLLSKQSIDYALMEKASSVVAARGDFDWDDVGSWSALADHLAQDSSANTLANGSLATLVDASNNVVYSPHKHVALCGVSDLVIVETEDALLICHKDKVQEVKKLLPNLPPELL